jgi:hypothetical protein
MKYNQHFVILLHIFTNFDFPRVLCSPMSWYSICDFYHKNGKFGTDRYLHILMTLKGQSHEEKREIMIWDVSFGLN